MTAPVFLLEPADLAAVRAGDTVAVGGTEGHHGARVRRLRAGEAVDVVDGRGRRAHGSVGVVGPGGFAVNVTHVTDEPEPAPRLVVVQGLAKGDRADAAVEMLTECGVDAIVPWSARRSVAMWRGGKAQRGEQRWLSVARAATKQARRSRVPDIAELADTAAVAALLGCARLGLVLQEDAAARLSRLALPADGDVVLVVGPEGGIDPVELAEFSRAGALPVRMGESLLRTSTAGVAAAAVVLAGCGRWD